MLHNSSPAAQTAAHQDYSRELQLNVPPHVTSFEGTRTERYGDAGYHSARVCTKLIYTDNEPVGTSVGTSNVQHKLYPSRFALSQLPIPFKYKLGTLAPFPDHPSPAARASNRLSHTHTMTAREQQYASQDLPAYSRNSLDIRNEFSPQRGGLSTPATEGLRPPPKLGSPTAVTELLAMLDDEGALADPGAEMSAPTPAGESRAHALENLRTTPTLRSISNSNSNSISNSSGLSPQRILQDTSSGPESAPLFFDDTLAALSPSIDTAQTQNPHLHPEQPCIDPNLLSNTNSYVDSGIPLRARNSLETFADHDDTTSFLDEFTFDRRPSELASRSLAPGLQARGSISHSQDFWNLPSSGAKASSERPLEPPSVDQRLSTTSLVRPNHVSHRSFAGVLPSSLSTARPVSSGMRSESLKPSGSSTSPFKIDNELTQLLNDYNLSYSHQKATKIRTGSFNALTNSRKSSVSEPQHRVQKQRASTSLVDGSNQDLISKLYGEMATPRPRLTHLSWENAIMSDDEEDEEDEEIHQLKPLRNGRGNSQDILQQLESEINQNGSKFIHPNLLINDPNQILDNTSLDVANLSSGSAGSVALNPLQLSLTASTSPSSYTSNSNPKQRKTHSFSKPPRNSKSSSPVEEEEKPFKCQECTKAFRRSEHLKRHIRSVHSSERPFHCSYCDKKFSRSDNLSQHLKTHKKHGDF